MNGRPPTWLLALAVPVIAVIAVLVTRAVEGPSSSAAVPAGANVVTIKNFAFVPPRMTVTKGTTLKVTNADDTTHTFTARNGSFDTGDLAGGSSAAVVLNRTGTFSYFCQIHSSMHGVLVVK